MRHVLAQNKQRLSIVAVFNLGIALLVLQGWAIAAEPMPDGYSKNPGCDPTIQSNC